MEAATTLSDALFSLQAWEWAKMRRTIAGRGCGDLVGKPRRECCAGSILGHKDAQGSVYFCDWCEDKLMIAEVTCF